LYHNVSGLSVVASALEKPMAHTTAAELKMRPATDFFVPNIVFSSLTQNNTVFMDSIEFYKLSRMQLFPYKKYPSERGFHIVKTFFSLIFYQ